MEPPCRFETVDNQEKCVDISLAVEMLYLATIPNAYEIACIVTGDKDFMPAMQKTRMLGKRVALCSMRNGCNADLAGETGQLRDFDVIWLEDYFDEIIVPNEVKNGEHADSSLRMCFDIIDTPRTTSLTADDNTKELLDIFIKVFTIHL